VQQVVDSIGLERGDVSVSLDEDRLRERGLTATDVAEVRAALSMLLQHEREALAAQLERDGRVTIAGREVGEREVILRFQNSISDTLNDVARASARLTAFSLIFSAWSASAMFGAVRKSINVVWKVEYGRAYLQQKLVDLLMVFAFGVLMLASVVGTAIIRALRQASDGFLGPISEDTGVIWSMVPWVLPGMLTFVVFALVYRLVPAVKVRFRDVWFGALLAALLFEVLKNGFAFYVANFRAYDLLYGSLGGILLFLTAVYFGSAILLFGAELAAAMPGLRAGAFEGVRDPSRPRPGLLGQVRNEVWGFFRSIVWSTDTAEDDREKTAARGGGK
jgi:membrane protein